MASQQSDDEDEITQINVTPLVDIMLVLLIVFMVTTTYMVNRTINVNLPKAEITDSKTTTKNLGFVLDKDSKLYLDGQPVDFDSIKQAIDSKVAEFKKESLTPQALITADKDTPHGAVVKLIDAVRKNGITDFAINVESIQAIKK